MAGEHGGESLMVRGRCGGGSRSMWLLSLTSVRLHNYNFWKPILVASWLKAWVCSRSPAEMAGSIPTWDKEVCQLWVSSGSGLCDELIIRPEESYRMWSLIFCDLETLRTKRQWSALGRSATGKKNTFKTRTQNWITILLRWTSWYVCSPRSLDIISLMFQFARRRLYHY